MKLAIFLMIILLDTSLCLAENTQENADSSGTAFTLFKSKTFVKNPLDLRDPFKRKINRKRAQQAIRNRDDGIYTNQVETIENKPIESIRIVGVLVGKERRALAKIAGNIKSNEVFYIKEGMKIGPNGAEVRAILPGGIVLVEKIRNVYDQDEYLETVIPLSNE